MSVQITTTGRAMSEVDGQAPGDRAWPHISRALRVDSAGTVDHDFLGWLWCIRDKLSPAELAVAYEEWADFFEYRLAQRSDQLANDRSLRYLLETWTDSMANSCRRSAAFARGEDPGPVIPQSQRRPDIFDAR